MTTRRVPEVHVPDLPELAPDELMKLERETTGLYLSGHPMDAYREKLKGANVVSIGAILESFSEHTDEFSDEQVVSIAGIVQNVKMKTTKNQSMMAYVTLEDDTGSMELLTFSNALGQYGSLLYETSAVVISGRISVRDDKDPQMVVNRVWKLADFDAKGEARAESRQALASKTLYLKIAHTGQKGSEKIRPDPQHVPRAGQDRHLLRRHRRSHGRALHAGGNHAGGAARAARRKKCRSQMRIILQNRYTSVTNCDTMICDVM